jgi:hypothetical protein
MHLPSQEHQTREDIMRLAITIPTAMLEQLMANARRAAAQPDHRESRLKHTLGRLSEDQMAELLALSHVGRSQNGESEWSNALQQAQALDGSDRLAHLLATDDLADVVEDGLIEIGCALMDEQEMDAA